MPEYTYVCEKCGKDKTVIRLMSEDEVKPHCCRAAMSRVYMPPQVISDEYDQPMKMTTMKPVWHNGPKHTSGRRKGQAKFDVVHSESERKQWLRDANDQLAKSGDTGTFRPTIECKNFRGKRITPARAAS